MSDAPNATTASASKLAPVTETAIKAPAVRTINGVRVDHDTVLPEGVF